MKNLKLKELSLEEQKNIEGGIAPVTRRFLNAVGAFFAAVTDLNTSMGDGSANDFYNSGSPKY